MPTVKLPTELPSYPMPIYFGDPGWPGVSGAQHRINCDESRRLLNIRIDHRASSAVVPASLIITELRLLVKQARLLD
jgi:hypothetical protein